MNLRPSAESGRESARAITITSMTNSAGIPILLNFSIPLEMPPLTMTMQMPMKSAVNIPAPKGALSIAVNTAPPPAVPPRLLLRSKLSSAMLSAVYWMQ